MSHVRRAVACIGALAVALLFALAASRRGAADPASTAAADAAVAWLKTQQQPDGGFEVAGSPASRRATPCSRSPSRRRPARRGAPREALAAVGALQGRRLRARRRSTTSTPTPRRSTTAGAAAKTIVLVDRAARPRPDRVRPAGDGRR